MTRKPSPSKVVEELCTNDSCPSRERMHWHPLSVESFHAEDVGEYTITVRVRRANKGRARAPLPPRKAGKKR